MRKSGSPVVNTLPPCDCAAAGSRTPNSVQSFTPDNLQSDKPCSTHHHTYWNRHPLPHELASACSLGKGWRTRRMGSQLLQMSPDGWPPMYRRKGSCPSAMPRQRSSAASKRGIGRVRVLRVRLDEKVYILRKARLRIMNNREAAYNEIPNAMGPEGGQKVFVVLVHLARSPTP
jgi:hypothetical protein